MIDQILQQQGDFFPAEAKGPNKNLGKDAFLKLLVTQLQHQDPLNPMDDKDFISQLAQFSSLEQMSNVAAGIGKLTEKTTQQDMLSAVNYIGKEITASGDTLSKTDTAVSPVFFILDSPAKTVTANVYDANKNLVYSEKMNAMQKGEYNFTWNGKAYDGKTAKNGEYSVAFAVESPSGKPVFVNTEVSGSIIGIEKKDNETFFKLTDGRTVGFQDIKKVIQPSI